MGAPPTLRYEPGASRPSGRIAAAPTADARGVELPQPLFVAALAREYGVELDSRLTRVVVRRIVEPTWASAEDDLVFVANPRAAVPSSAVAICVPQLSAKFDPARCLVHAQPLWVLACLLERVEAQAKQRFGEASVDPNASLAEGVVVQPGARIGSGTIVEENTVIYAGVHVGRGARIGANSVIGRPGFGFVEGPDGIQKRMPQLGGVVVEDDVEIGPLCTVDAGTLVPTRVKRGSKLDAHVHVGHNVVIGQGCLIAAQVGFAGSVVVGDGVRVGGQAGFKDHVRVGDGARIAAKSGVIGNIPPGAVVAGFPAVDKGRWLRAMAELLRGKRQT